MGDHRRRAASSHLPRPNLGYTSDLRYTTGIPTRVPVFGRKPERTASRPPVDATRIPEFGSKLSRHTYVVDQPFKIKQNGNPKYPNDIYRNANDVYDPPSHSMFKRGAAKYHQDGNYAHGSRKIYYDNSELDGMPYNDRSAQDAEWAADSTRREKERRQHYMNQYIGYDDFNSFKGHLEKIRRTEEREKEMKAMQRHHRIWEKEEEKSPPGWFGRNEQRVKDTQKNLLNSRQTRLSRYSQSESVDRGEQQPLRRENREEEIREKPWRRYR